MVFVKYFDKGSTVLGAEQMVPALAEHGVEGRIVHAHELAGIRDSILIFIKTSKVHHLVAARSRGNLLVLDVQDTLCFKRRLKNRPLYHGIIFRSQKPLDDYGDGKTSVKIYLQWNLNYQPNRVGDREFRLGYLGDPRSLEAWEQLPEVTYIGESGFFQEAPRFNCHLSIRSTRRDWLYKPTCKVSTAAACEANLVTTRDEGTVEVLGPDYPYYTDGDDPESIRRTIALARESFGTEMWEAGLAKMREVKETHRLEKVACDYVDFLTRLEGSSGA